MRASIDLRENRMGHRVSAKCNASRSELLQLRGRQHKIRAQDGACLFHQPSGVVSAEGVCRYLSLGRITAIARRRSSIRPQQHPAYAKPREIESSLSEPRTASMIRSFHMQPPSR